MPLRSLMALFFSFSVASAQTPKTDSVLHSSATWLDSLETVTHYALDHLEEVAPPGYKKQRELRLEFYRKGYADVLQAFLRQDGIGGILAFVRSRLHVEFSMPHKTFWIVPPTAGTSGIPFPDDWVFPADPWRRPPGASR